MSAQSHQLKSASLGVADIVFFVVAAAAPLGATLGAGPVVFAIGGSGAPGIYLLASVVLLLFAIGFAAMSRYVSSAGGFADLVRKGVGESAGHAAAGVAILAYICMLVGISGQLSAFGSETVNSFFGVALPWELVGLVGIFSVGVFGYLDVNVSAKVLGVLMILEVLILLLLDVAVLVRTPTFDINFDAFSPSAVMGPGLGVALMFAFACFVGFESTTIYGEEAKNPQRTIPMATYISILTIGIFYTVTTWCIGIAYGKIDVSKAAMDEMTNFVFNINTQYVGLWSTQLMKLLVVTSIFAVLLAFHNALSRYIFSLGREKFFPSALARIHPRHASPHIASIVLTIATLGVFLLFVLAGADPVKHLYMWMVGLGTLGILVVQAMGAIAVVGFYFKTKKYGVWPGLVAPILGGGGLFVAVYLATRHFDELIGAKDSAATMLPWLVFLAAVLGGMNGHLRRLR